MSGLCHLVLGPMFAKKTTRVIMYKRRLDNKGSKTLIFKHYSDMRYDDGTQVTSHDNDSEHCIPIHNTSEIFTTEGYTEADVIIIEEGQFFDKSLVEDCRQIVNVDSKYLIVSALSGDYKMRPFGYIHELICIASSVEMAAACCNYCTEIVDARYTVKINGSDNQVEVGVDKYVPACRKHHLEHSNYALYKEQKCDANSFVVEYHTPVNTVSLINFPEAEYSTLDDETCLFEKKDDTFVATVSSTVRKLHILSDVKLSGHVHYYVDNGILSCHYKEE